MSIQFSSSIFRNVKYLFTEVAVYNGGYLPEPFNKRGKCLLLLSDSTVNCRLSPSVLSGCPSTLSETAQYKGYVLSHHLCIHSFQQVYFLLLKSLFLTALVVAPTRFSHVHIVYKHDTPANVTPVAVFPARGKPVNSCFGCKLISSPARSQLKADKTRGNKYCERTCR